MHPYPSEINQVIPVIEELINLIFVLKFNFLSLVDSYVTHINPLYVFIS